MVIIFVSLLFSEFREPTTQERKEKLDKYISFDAETGRECCGVCKVSYATHRSHDSYRVLLNHIEAKHVKVISYFCPYCKKGFYSANQKSGHITTSHREQHRKSKMYYKRFGAKLDPSVQM